MYEAKNGKICNFWTIWPVIQLINDHLQIWLRHICPTVHRFKKCYDISEVASVGGGEIAYLKACHFSPFEFQLCHQRSLLKCHCTFNIYGPLVKKVFVRFLKDALLTELSPRMYRSCPSNVLQDVLVDNSFNRHQSS